MGNSCSEIQCETAIRIQAALADRSFADSYILGSKIEDGRFGTVYSCRSVRDRSEEHAVKIVNTADTPDNGARKEACILQRLDHENIVKCYDVFYEDDAVSIVMEKMHGGDLGHGIQQFMSRGRIASEQVSPIGAQMLEAIHYLHQNEIIHRDVKPENYLSEHADMTAPENRIVLADFGTAVACRPDERLHQKCGTKPYWAPEFVLMDYASKVDIWALGVVVYTLLTGQFPFADEKESLRKALKTPSFLPPECCEVLSSMLEKHESKRADTSQLMMFPLFHGMTTA